MVIGLFRTLHSWLRFTIDAAFARNLSLGIRLRLIAAQPLIWITYAIAAFPWALRRPFRVEYLPIAPDRSLRALIFMAPSIVASGSTHKRRPLHLDCHGGGFLGGLPESDAAFCDKVAKETGAVVVSTTYRYAPRYPFPGAIDDIDAVLAYLRANADKYGVDPDLITVSGFSAGGNLVLAAALSAPAGVVKGAVTFYAPIDLRLKPDEKPKPESFPAKDPLSFMLPLFDSYAGPVRDKERDNVRMSPILARLEDLPENMLLVIPGIDILVHEQTMFVDRLNEEKSKDPRQSSRRIEKLYLEKGFHGWLERRYWPLRLLDSY